MRQLRAAAVLMLASAWPAPAAEKLPPLDPEFLEYLASFGGDDEDWTLFAEDAEPAAKPPPAKDPAARREGSKTEAAAKPAEKR